MKAAIAACWPAALVLADSSPGLTWTPMISQQSLQQLANQCAGFHPPPDTPRLRVGTKQSQRCFLVQGLFSALSVMLGQTASHLILAILTADTTRRATRYCSRTPMLTERAASPWVCAPLCAHVDCVQLADMQLADVQ